MFHPLPRSAGQCQGSAKGRGLRCGAASLSGLFAATLAAPAWAEEITVTPLVDTRLQIENVNVDSLPEPSQAATFRIRGGAELARGRLGLRVEGQANIALVDDYADGLNGRTDRPVIADPENLALYQAYLSYAAPGVTATVGRQEISLDDERFVGTAPIRQNAQNFDAARLKWSGVEGLTVDVAYAWSFRTVWGRDGTGARPEAANGDNIFVNIAARTGLGTLTGFAYLIDLDDARGLPVEKSSATYGMRLTGEKALRRGLRLAYLASYARQFDYADNPVDYAADFAALEGTAIMDRWSLGAGFELLGADRGVAFTSFQTPFSSGVKFLGLAGRFLPTPPDGVRDYYGLAQYDAGTIGPFRDVSLKAVLHHFTSDRLVRSYGSEVDLTASGELGPSLLTLRYADYRENGFSADTKRFMLQLEWKY